MANNNSKAKVITGMNTRLSYFHGWEPVSINGGAEKYSVSVLIPKDDTATVNAINAAVDAAIEDGIAKFGGKKPNKAAIKLPLRDGDAERDDEAYKGHYFINANSNTAPQIVDRAVKPILDRSEVYSGCYARVSLNFYAFNSNGNKGIAAVWATSRRCVTESLSAAERTLRMTSLPSMTMTSCHKEGADHDTCREFDACGVLRRGDGFLYRQHYRSDQVCGRGSQGKETQTR